MTNAALDAEFDPVWYLAQFPDVAQSGMDPREHFLRIGRRLGRPGAPDRPAPPPAGSPAALPQPAILSPEPAADAAQAMIRRLAADLPPPGPAPVAVRSIVPGSPVTFPIIAAPAGLTQIVADRNALLRRVPGPDSAVLRSGTVDVAQFADTAAFAQGVPLLLLLAHLHGADPAALFALDSGMSAPPMRLDPAPAPAALAATALLGPLLLQGATRITDIWHSTSAGLCLSLGSGNDAPDEAADASDGLTLRMFQMEPGGVPRLRLVGQQRLARQVPGFAEAALCNPLCPLLIELSDARGMTLELGLIPFPSLARGGMHYAELLAVADGGTLLATLLGYGAGRLAEFLAGDADASQGIGAVRIASGQATGAEPVFSQAAADWLALFGLTPRPHGDAAGGPAVPATAVPLRRRAAGLTLDLPPEAMPTIAALTLRDLPAPAPGTVRAVPHLIADTATFRPRWAVTLPATPPGLAALQPTMALGGFPCLRADPLMTAGPDMSGPESAGSDSAGSAASGREALAICYRTPLREEDARHLMPLSPDSATAVLPGIPAAAADAVVTCLLRVTDAALTRQFLDTLGAQQGTARTEVILIPADRAQAGVLTPELAARFAGTLREAAPGWSCWTAAQDDPLEAAAGDSLFLAEDAAVLHDPRTLDTLRALLAVPDVATAGCVLVTETVRRGTLGVTSGIGGYFPSHVGLAGGPHLIFDTPDMLSALPAATYPVIASPATALMVRRDVLRQVRASGALRGVAPGAPAALAFGLAVLAAGGHNLCTSAVRVGLARQPAGQDVMDPVGLRRIAPARWEDLLAKVTLIKGLKG